MVDVDAAGGLQVIVKELLDAGFLDGSALTCTGETLAEQVATARPAGPRPRGHLQRREAVQGHRRTAPAAGQPGPRRRRHLEGGRRRGRRERRRLHRPGPGLQRRARSSSTRSTTTRTRSRTTTWWSSATPGPGARPGMPELLDPTSRITALCRQRDITIALMTDARFSGGSVGLVIGHVAPEAFLGRPDRAGRGRRHHRDRRQHGPDRLPAAGRPRRGRAPGRRPGGRRPRPTAASTPT